MLLVLFCAGCPPATTDSTEPAGGAASAGQGAADFKAGQAVYAAQGCAQCHGPDMAGKDTIAPPLKGLAANWTAEKLSEYLQDPQGYADRDPRLAANRGHFSMRMPPYKIAPAEEAELIKLLLSR